MKYELHSPLSPSECVQRIAAKLETSAWVHQQGRPFWGMVEEGKFSLRLAHGMRNPFAPYLRGTLEPTPTGTLLRGECGIVPGLKIAALVWVLLWVIPACIGTLIVEVILVGLLSALGENLTALGSEMYPLLAMPVLLLPLPFILGAFALFFPALFIAVRRGDCEKIIELLKDTLEAVVV